MFALRMPLELHHRSLWSGAAMRLAPLPALMDAAQAASQRLAPAAELPKPLTGRHVAILCAHPTRLLDDFGLVVVDLGAQLTLLNGPAWVHSVQGRLPQAAQLLGRMYDLVDVCDLDAAMVDQIEQHAHIPVFDGLARADHEFHLLAELMTMRQMAGRPLAELCVRIAGVAGDPLHAAAEQAAQRLQLTVLHTPELVPALVPTLMPTQGDDMPWASGVDSFVLDPLAPMDAGRLAFEHAPVVDKARWLSDVARNRRLLLKAAVQAVMVAKSG
jgi:ornithine carbamoyltransferase